MPRTKTFAEISAQIPGEATELFNQLTLNRIEKGFKHYSAYAIMHQMRWHMETPDIEDDFKIPNNWGAVLAREFHEMYPEHKGFFRIRRCWVSNPDEVLEESTDEEVAPSYATVQTANRLLARNFLQGRAPAIEGQGGHDHTYATACQVLDFGVSTEEALELLVEWNERCEPPWSRDELASFVGNASTYRKPLGSGPVTADELEAL